MTKHLDPATKIYREIIIEQIISHPLYSRKEYPLKTLKTLKKPELIKILSLYIDTEYKIKIGEY